MDFYRLFTSKHQLTKMNGRQFWSLLECLHEFFANENSQLFGFPQNYAQPNGSFLGLSSLTRKFRSKHSIKVYTTMNVS